MTKIEWTHRPGTRGVSWNPLRARNKATGFRGHYCAHVSPGCANCYAERMQPRFGNPIRYAAQDLAKVEPFLDEDALHEPLAWREPRTAFVCSMSDLFGEWVADAWIDRVFAVMALCPQHVFIVLTKRAERMRDFLRTQINWFIESPAVDGKYPSWPLSNVWLGVSVEDQERANERIPLLLDTPAAVRFVSAEPLLGPVDFERIAHENGRAGHYYAALSGYVIDGSQAETARVDWLICGGESGPKARPMHPDWARQVRDQCRAAGVPFFFKQWGEWAPAPPEAKWSDYDAWPEHRKVLWSSGDTSLRAGKKAAGALLDGRAWSEWPA